MIWLSPWLRPISCLHKRLRRPDFSSLFAKVLVTVSVLFLSASNQRQSHYRDKTFYSSRRKWCKERRKKKLSAIMFVSIAINTNEFFVQTSWRACSFFCESCDILINRKRELRRSEAIKTNDTHMKFVDAKMKKKKKRQHDIIMRNVNKCVTMWMRTGRTIGRVLIISSLFIAPDDQIGVFRFGNFQREFEYNCEEICK